MKDNKKILNNWSRRNLLKLAGFLGSGFVLTTLAQAKNSSAQKSTPLYRTSSVPQSIAKTETNNDTPVSFQANTKTEVEWKNFQYEVVTVDKKGQIIDRTQKQAKSFLENLGNGINLEMIPIAAGTFNMGSLESEFGDFTGSERPQHQVQLKAFGIGKYPITQAQWKAISTLPKINRDLNPNPSFFQGDNLPVERVSWYDAVEFCARLSQLTGRKYRLPTEAEWEYACRAGTTTPFYFGQTIIDQLANYFAAYDPYPDAPTGGYKAQTTPVGNYPANAFGIYDMHGNIAQWCEDLWHEDYEGATTDGSAWLEIDNRINSRYQQCRLLRGSSWGDEGRHCRSANRTFCPPEKKYSVIGFRVVTVEVMMGQLP